MKQTIEAPWSVGDTGWSILTRNVRERSVCQSCSQAHDKTAYTYEVLECRIDSIVFEQRKKVSVIDPNTKELINEFWYHVAFDVGDGSYPEYGRFTYGKQVDNVFATLQEAEAHL